MRTPIRRTALLVLPLALAAACQGEEAPEEAAPADTVEATAAPAPTGDQAVTGGIAVSSSTSDAMITNAMPHAMVVSVEYEGGGSSELGVVPANGEQTFTIAASSGETVTLVATDEAETHSRSETLELAEGQTETWTIE